MRPNQAAPLLSALLLILITACGGTLSAPRIPVFTSTPGTDAAEGATYSYQITTADGTDTLALTNAPAGATLRGNTLGWVPAAAQSRTANSFTVTATTTAGRSATQSWTVVPRGTIRISWINNFWNENGSTYQSMDWSRIGPLIAVLVPQADGSFQPLSGAPGADGDFEIPNVPAGYFWLRLGPKDTYWTSTSTFDAGADVFASSLSTGSANTTTRVNFSFTGLEPTSLNGWLQFLTPDSLALNFSGTTAAGSDTFTSGILMNGNVDLSAVRNAFVMQYKPTTLGYLPGAVLGPDLSLTNLSLTTGGVNTISGALHPSVPAVLSLSVAASAWAVMFDHVAPAPPNSTGGSIAVLAEPYTDVNSPNSPWSSAPHQSHPVHAGRRIRLILNVFGLRWDVPGDDRLQWVFHYHHSGPHECGC